MSSYRSQVPFGSSVDLAESARNYDSGYFVYVSLPVPGPVSVFRTNGPSAEILESRKVDGNSSPAVDRYAPILDPIFSPKKLLSILSDRRPISTSLDEREKEVASHECCRRGHGHDFTGFFTRPNK